ncbi:MAG TPA: alpha/beta fold hydrolase [Planctomycetaceae bacterium]|jgi:pimeloyl-ACP methyl ester carboxylesterase|nr:alpha/beta fold hydrolase [Planctomycetaceae bacterium]
MSIVFKDSLFDAQWLRAASHASSGAAEIGECLAVASQIRELDAESWFKAWNDLGERMFAVAQVSEAEGRRVSARDAYLRASNYLRAAYTFLIGSPVDPRVIAGARRHRAAFEAGLALMDSTIVERIAIPYGDSALHGYFFQPRDDNRGSGEQTSRPCLIITGGYDSSAEGCYFFSGRAAVERGYSCLVYDGPGQGKALIEDGMVFRPDWEAVVRPVVDYAIARPEVDPKRVAIMGISFGGYLAPRAASGEPRLAACICDPGDFSLFEEFLSRLPAFVARQLPDGNRLVLKLLDISLRRRMRHLTAGWAIRRGLWTHAVATPLEYIRSTRDYSLEGRVALIECPTLVCSAEDDAIGVTAQRLYDGLTCEKTRIRFLNSEGAGEHCETGARTLFNQRAFDWLDKIFER